MIFIFIFSMFLLYSTNAVPLNEFFPFGSDKGDTILSSQNISEGRLSLPSVFPYFDHFHTELIIAPNGLIIFNPPSYFYYYYSPSSFPLQDNASIVAAFWHQTIHSRENETSDRVYYQIYNTSSTSNVFEKAKNYVNRFFPQERSFQAKMIITGTWYYIGSENDNETSRLNNTFQIVLATDEDRSFVFLLYHQLQWSNPYNNSYYLAQAGFHSGIRNISEPLPYSGTNEIVKLVEKSNVNIPGLYIYRVDVDKINAGGCNETISTISFRPRFGSQLGSTPMSIYGLCFTNQTKVQCRFNSSSSLQIIDGFVLDEFRAICLTPLMPTHGLASVDVSIDNGRTFRFAGIFTYLPPLLDSNEITVRMANKQELLSTGENVTLQWRFSDLIRRTFPVGTLVEIQLWKISINEQSHLQINPSPIILASQSATIDSARVTIPQGVSTCFIRVVARFNGNIYAGLNSDLLIVKSSPATAAESCQNWAKQQLQPSTWNRDALLPCPMTRDQVLRAGFCCYEPESHCRKENSNSNNCYLHQGRADRDESSAVECHISKYANSHGAGAQCCYDKDGMIITRGLGAGTDDRYRPTTSPVQHFFHDKLPYIQCCLMSTDSESCNTYMRFRPPRRGSNTMGDTGRMWGDPHFGTLDGSSYTFNGYGEYTYLAITNRSSPAPPFDPTNQPYVFMSQIRTVPIARDGPTITTGFAARSSNPQAKAVSLIISSRQQIVIRRGDEVVEFEDHLDKLIFPELTLTRNPENDLASYTFSWDMGVTIVIKLIRMTSPSKRVVLDVGASLSGSFRGKTYGLLGTYDGIVSNDLRSRNGTIISPNASLEQIHRNFGMTWAIDPSTSMFSYESNQTAQWFYTQNAQFTPSFDDPALSTTSNPSHRLACNISATASPSSWNLAQRSCYYDLAKTNDRSFAQASLDAGTALVAMQRHPDNYPLFNSSLPLSVDVNVGQSVILNISATSDNPSHPVIILSAVHLPRNGLFNGSTGRFQWMAIEGEHYLAIEALDKTNNLKSKHEIAFQVAPAGRGNGHSFKTARFLLIILAIAHLFV